MGESFKNPTPWNEFYEKAWLNRQQIMSSIIESGETHPLRVISIFSSILRFSSEELKSDQESEHDNRFVCDTDSKYIKSDIRNVKIVNNGGCINIIPHENLPAGMLADHRFAHRNKYNIGSSYSDCDKIAFVTDYCRHRKFDAIIELGSGYSQNLIKLFYQGGPKVPYFGGEFTQSGTECAQMLSNLSDEINLTPFRFDFRQPDLSNIPRFERVLVFTNHAIEQVNHIPDNLLLEIASVARQVTCIHMEPFGFQMAPAENESDVDKKHREYFRGNGWNENLFNQLANHSCKGNIDLQYVGKNILGGSDFHNPSSLALWKTGF